jgi:hypothetical protein
MIVYLTENQCLIFNCAGCSRLCHPVPGAPGGSPNKIINQKGRRVERWSYFVGDKAKRAEFVE